MAAAAPVLLLAAACAQPGTQPGAAPDDPAGGYGPDELVLRVEYIGGFTTPEVLATRLPVVSVYGDGRVITEGPQIMIYPGPALPNVLQATIDPADVDRLVELATEAGIGTLTAEDFAGVPDPRAADVPATRFTLRTAAGLEVLDVPLGPAADGLLPADPAVQPSGDVAEALADLAKFRDALTDLPGTLGGDAVSEPQPYQPDAIAAVASPWTADEELPDQPELAWPGPDLPGEALNADLGLYCVAVTGDTAAELLELAAEATTATPWTSAGERWRLTLRPLLPDETGCADLTPEIEG